MIVHKHMKGNYNMNNKKKMYLVNVIIYFICAIVWNTIVVLDFTRGDLDSLSFVLHTVCAVLFDFCVIIWFVAYRKAKKEEENNK